MTDINPDVHIRKAIPEDVPALMELVRSAMLQYAQVSGIPTLLDAQRETTNDMLRHVVEDTVLIAESHGHLVGTVRLTLLPDRTAYFSRFAVSTRQQQSGIGKKLIVIAQALLQEAGAAEILLHTAIKNKALVGLYTGKGFELVAVSTDRGYERGLFRKRLVMEPDAAPAGQEGFGQP